MESKQQKEKQPKQTTKDEAIQKSTVNSATHQENLLPKQICILPLSERPFFPPQSIPILMNQDVWQDSISFIAEQEHKYAGLLLAKKDEIDQCTSDDLHEIGTLIRIHQPVIASGKVQFIAEGVTRFRIKKWLNKTPPFIADIEYAQEPQYDNIDEIKAYAIAIFELLKELVPFKPKYQEEIQFFLSRFNANQPSAVADFAASLTTADKSELQDVLSTVHLFDRIQKAHELIQHEKNIAQMQYQLKTQVDKTLNEQQRRFFLREQLKVIRQELGIEKDDRTADIERFNLHADELKICPIAETKFKDEISKLGILEIGSPEYALTRNYLDLLTKLPWNRASEDNFDMLKVKGALDCNHTGLDDVKRRLTEILAIAKIKGELGGKILLLVGPPGVGKTSIGRSIAEALNRQFYRFSVGGLKDEAEIKGHRKTYIGAMPGKIIRALEICQTKNPVLMLDEIDKVVHSASHDPSAALLEALDQEQNQDFLDHYLEVPFDLSNVLFVCTANQTDTIPEPLLDRMEVLRLPGYIASEKYEIAKKHLWPRLLAQSGIKKTQLVMSKGAMNELIDGYSREAGVRTLYNLLEKIIGKCAIQLLEQPENQIKINQSDIIRLLGERVFHNKKPTITPGVAIGMGWNRLGGAILEVECIVVHTRHSEINVTGNLGDIMHESARIAYAFISHRAAQYQIDLSVLNASALHIHVPEGATPKDGPSAGITIATAILSCLTNRAPKKIVAMTGELSLTGKVMPVGGIKEKVIAAHRNGVTQLILPSQNEADVAKIPEQIRSKLTFEYVKHFDDVVKALF
jgi:ATP-dependent Lon protease